MDGISHLNKKIVDTYWREVWVKFEGGDIKSFELIYNNHVDFLFKYSVKITADTDMVEDTIHDLFLYILSSKDNLLNPDYLRYYLLKAFKRILLELYPGIWLEQVPGKFKTTMKQRLIFSTQALL